VIPKAAGELPKALGLNPQTLFYIPKYWGLLPNIIDNDCFVVDFDSRFITMQG
jgi:hypothetical protein